MNYETQDQTQSSGSKKGTLMAFAIGAAAGGVAALLMAPDKGQRTRRQIAEGTKSLVNETKSAVVDRAKGIGSAAVGRKEAVKEAVNTAKQVYRKELEHSSYEPNSERNINGVGV